MGDNIKTIGGAILKTKNGEIEVNNTIEARMLRFKKSLRSEVAADTFQINRGDLNGRGNYYISHFTGIPLN